MAAKSTGDYSVHSKMNSLTISSFSPFCLASRLGVCRVVFEVLVGTLMKSPLHCTTLGEKVDSSVAQAAGASLDHHWWAPRKDRVNTLAPVVAAGDDRWLSGSSSTL